MKSRDGTIYSDGLISNLGSLPDLPPFLEARIDEILYTDNPKNTTYNSDKKEIEYNCTVVTDVFGGLRIFNVKDTVESGGKYNKSGHVRQAMRSGNIDSPATDPEKTDGDFVLISFIEKNNPHRAKIIRGLPHPQGKALDIPSTEGGKKFFEYNGTCINIDKNGALTISFGGGPKDQEGQPADESAAGSAITIDQSGVIKIDDGEGQTIEFDKSTKSLKINSSQGIEMEAGAALSLDISGSITIKGGGTLNLDGAIVQIGGGGNLAARVGDIAVGTGNEGAPVVSTIQTGSSTTLIGG